MTVLVERGEIVIESGFRTAAPWVVSIKVMMYSCASNHSDSVCSGQFVVGRWKAMDVKKDAAQSLGLCFRVLYHNLTPKLYAISR